MVPPLLGIKNIADGLVIGALLKCVIVPVSAIFNGDLWGPGAFLAGAIVVSTIMFGEFYFRETLSE